MTTVPFRFSLVSLLLFFLLLGGNAAAADAAGKESIAILPFPASAGKDISYLQAGIRNMLASRLAAETGLRIIEHARVDQQAAAAGDLMQQNTLTALG
ncbi:MAG: hypothetical protein HY789_13960, partial [Deltaproteobacteria bacterium]|nr:hypothetical protein [Deltaproteobacteria bacterium]